MADGARLYQLLRGRLYEELPVLALPLGLLDWREGDAPGTDGTFFYAPLTFLEAAVKAPEEAKGVLLHSTMHAVLCHMYLRGEENEARWSLACDLTAAFLARKLLQQPLDGALGRAYYALQKGTAFSAKAVYAQLGESFPVPEQTLRACIQLDDHQFWKAPQQAERKEMGGARSGPGRQKSSGPV